MSERLDIEVAGRLFVDVVGLAVICRDGTVESMNDLRFSSAQFACELRDMADFIEAHPGGFLKERPEP